MAKTIYTKTDASGRQIFSDCRVIELNGTWISNPSAEQIAAAGWVEYVPPVIPPAPKDEPDYSDMLAAVKRMLSSSIEDLPDEDAIAVAALYPTWRSALEAGKIVNAGERYWDDGTLWKCKQSHIPQDDGRPRDTPAMGYEVSIEEWPEGIQPIDSESAYHTGDKVTHNDKHWVSTVDNNVWEPGVYGGNEV